MDPNIIEAQKTKGLSCDTMDDLIHAYIQNQEINMP